MCVYIHVCVYDEAESDTLLAEEEEKRCVYVCMYTCIYVLWETVQNALF
jgi:hypothetical protein